MYEDMATYRSNWHSVDFFHSYFLCPNRIRVSRIGHVTLLQCLFFGPVRKIFFYFKPLKLKKKYSTRSRHKKYKKLIVILLTTPVSYWKVLLYSERKITESYAETVHVVIYFFFFVIFYYLHSSSCL